MKRFNPTVFNQESLPDRVTIEIEVAIEETPIRYSEKEKIVKAILSGEHKGALYPGRPYPMLWCVVTKLPSIDEEPIVIIPDVILPDNWALGTPPNPGSHDAEFKDYDENGDCFCCAGS